MLPVGPIYFAKLVPMFSEKIAIDLKKNYYLLECLKKGMHIYIYCYINIKLLHLHHSKINHLYHDVYNYYKMNLSSLVLNSAISVILIEGNFNDLQHSFLNYAPLRTIFSEK